MPGPLLFNSLPRCDIPFHLVIVCLKLPSCHYHLCFMNMQIQHRVESILPVFSSTNRIIRLLSVKLFFCFSWTDWKIDGRRLTTLRHLTTSSCSFFPVFHIRIFFALFFFVCFFSKFEKSGSDDQVQPFPAPLEDTRSGLNDPDRPTTTKLVTCTICDPFSFLFFSNQKTRYFYPSSSMCRRGIGLRYWLLQTLLFSRPVGFALLAKPATKAIR